MAIQKGELNMPMQSESQRRAMWAAASGKSNIGIPKSVGKEFADKDQGGKLPEKKAKDADITDRVSGPLGSKLLAEYKSAQLQVRDAKNHLDMVQKGLNRGFSRNDLDKAKAWVEQCQRNLALSVQKLKGYRKMVGLDADPMPSAAGTMYIAPDGDILMLRRSGYGDAEGHWSFPAGKIEDGETAHEAAHREAREEMGDATPECKNCRLLHKGDGFHTYAQAVDKKFVPALDKEHTGYCWAPFDKLPSPLHPGVADMLRDCMIPDGSAKDMTPEDWSGLTGGLIKFLSEEMAEPEHQGKDASPEMEAFRVRRQARVDAAKKGEQEAQSLADEVKRLVAECKKLGGMRYIGDPISRAVDAAKTARADFGLAGSDMALFDPRKHDEWMAKGKEDLAKAKTAVESARNYVAMERQRKDQAHDAQPSLRTFRNPLKVFA